MERRLPETSARLRCLSRLSLQQAAVYRRQNVRPLRRVIGSGADGGAVVLARGGA